MFYDSTYILVLIGAIICMAASAKVKNAFSQYSRVRSYYGLTGAQTAYQILSSEGINDVSIQHVSGSLTDHYDPAHLTLNLSDTVYNSTSIAAVAVAAHECGHAIQHARNYVPLKLRTAIVPAANIGSNLAWPLIIIGIILGSGSRYGYTGISGILIQGGIILFSLAVLFQLVTLPVEFDASRRALTKIDGMGILTEEEMPMAEKMLSAAALTYVASAAASILQLLRLVILFGGNNRRRR